MALRAAGTRHGRGPAVTAGTVLLLVVILPVLLGWACGFPPSRIFEVIVSIFVLQGLAAAAGIGLGLRPVLLLPVMASVAAGIIIGIFSVCDLFSGRSERIARWIGKVQGTMGRHQALKSYGEFMLIPIMWVPGIGLYGTPVVAWVLQWRGVRSMLLMLTGWLIACLVVVIMTEGIRAIF